MVQLPGTKELGYMILQLPGMKDLGTMLLQQVTKELENLIVHLNGYQLQRS